jgi:hypothetical protein
MIHPRINAKSPARWPGFGRSPPFSCEPAWPVAGAPELLAPFEAFSAQSQHLGRLDLTLVKLDKRHARKDVQKERESAD